MKLLIGTGAATLYGLSIRTIFGSIGGPLEIMSMSFLILSPLIIGFLTTFLVARKRYVSGVGAFFLPWITTTFLLILTILFALEGTICWIMIFPIFAVVAGCGGLIGNSVIKNRKKRKGIKDGANVLDNDFNGTLKVSILLTLPFVFGFLEGDKGSSRSDITIDRSIIIEADKSIVWNSLLSIGKVTNEEKSEGITSWIGFPNHIETTLDTAIVGGKRLATYERGLYFKETITELTKEKSISFKIDVDPKKIPPTVMDEHILIGGKHVDVFEDRYSLTLLPDGTTKLSLSSDFMINTPFNWYTKIWAKLLMNDLLDSQLELIKNRSIK